MHAWLAETVFLVHFAFIVYVVAGGLLVALWPRTLWLHLAALLWGATVIVGGFICPLTPLENHLRGLAGEGGYESGFIEHYLMPVVYPPGLTRPVQLVLGFMLIFWNAVIYLYLWRRRRLLL